MPGHLIESAVKNKIANYEALHASHFAASFFSLFVAVIIDLV